MNLSVVQLRRSGYKVRVTHRRWYPTNDGYKLVSRFEADLVGYDNELGPASNGGETEVEITTPSGDTLKGVAQCSDKDSFNRKLGLNIALGRAFTGKLENV